MRNRQGLGVLAAMILTAAAAAALVWPPEAGDRVALSKPLVAVLTQSPGALVSIREMVGAIL